MIHTITFFAVSCPENPAFFRKNRQFFENIPRKILHILNILEKCCILEKSRKMLVVICKNSAKNKSGKSCEFFVIIDPLVPKDMFRLVCLVKLVFFAREGVAF